MEQETQLFLIYLVLGLLAFAVLMLILRGAYLWYFRINNIVDLLHEQNKTLKEIAHHLVKQEFKGSKSKNED